LTKAGSLSGGEKARLLFALMSREAPHLLILDEPTNHLDVDARQALVQAIGAYEGAVLLISHDPHLIELCADRLWLVSGGTVRQYDGDLDDYRELLFAERRNRPAGETKGNGAASGAAHTAAGRKEQRRAAAEERQQNAQLKKQAQQTERRLADLNKKKAAMETLLADPEIYNGPTSKLLELQLRYGDIKKEIAAAEDAWLVAQAALE
jgi:ATP-binding cassette subfamily F protein 3